MGATSLYYNTTGTNNIAIGHNDGTTYAALQSNTTGSYNVATGVGALANNTTANSNVAIGYQALITNTTGQYNTAIGSYAPGVALASLSNNTSGSYNIGVGTGSLGQNTTGANNVSIGYESLYSNTTAIDTVAVGNFALYYNTTGNYNIGIGYSANNATTGSNIVCIGYNTNPNANTDTNELVIATGTSTGKGSNTGFLNNNFGGTYQGNNSASWSTTSDQRLKKNIVTNTDGLNKVSQLVVRNFEYRLPEEVDPTLKPTDAIPITGTQIGFIAQELQDILPDCVKTESTGVMGINIENVTYHLVNAIKDLNALVTAQATEIAALKAKVGI